jgi:NodT family efflux transporter outer membrane factor (OMF) lipoprotein
VQAAWEVDLFGGNAATRDAAQARYDGAQADWHDARVSVAAEVANLYFSLRNCERLLAVSRFDARSRAESMRLTDLMTRAGFQAPGTLALARASSAEGAVRVTQQRALCDLDIKALVALASLDETRLREKLAEVPASMGRPPSYTINSLPASLLEQRPDLYSAERELMAARAEIGAADAQRYPRLSLNGTVGSTYIRVNGVSDNITNWSIGPVSLSLPLFDGGTRSAQVEAAEARYEAAAVTYRAKARQAVREVEEALVQLQSVSDRNEDALIATQGYRESFNSIEARYKNGLANLIELEDARRLALNSEITLVTLQRERMAAWVALYRAAGGGWTQSSTGPRFESSPVPAAASKP